MGCLTAAIYAAFLYDIDSSIENKNTGINIAVESTYNTVNVETGFIENALQIDVSLVCDVAPIDGDFLRVIEGNIITIEGQYIKVLRNGI